MKTVKAKKNWSSLSYIQDSIRQTLAKNYGILLVFLGAFLACVLISFFVISSTETVMAYSASEFEVGQIADRTIISDVSLPPDAAHPISVEDCPQGVSRDGGGTGKAGEACRRP